MQDTIQEHPDNNKILSEILADRILQVRQDNKNNIFEFLEIEEMRK